MDIRFVNKKNEIINATNLSIKRNDKFLIGEHVGGSITVIEEYENSEQAESVLEQIADVLLNKKRLSEKTVIIDLREKEGK